MQLIHLIIRYGKLAHTGMDFSKHRTDSLKDLKKFYPEDSVAPRRIGRKAIVKKNAFTKSLRGELAFLKNRLRQKGGHLSVPVLELCYIRIPKSASTALSAAMLHAKYPDLKMHAVSPEQVNYLADANLEEAVANKTTSAIFFSVVRNPFARIVSVYRQFFEGGSTKEFIYEDYLFGILSPACSFSEFLHRIRIVPDLLKDQHLMPQHRFIGYYEAQNVDVKIFRLEDPTAWSEFLAAYQLKPARINASGAAYDYRTYFDIDTLQTTLSIYEKDVYLFGYEPAYLELKAMVKKRS